MRLCCVQQPNNATPQQTKSNFAEAFLQADCGHFHGRAEGQIPQPPKLFPARGGAYAPPCASVGGKVAVFVDEDGAAAVVRPKMRKLQGVEHFRKASEMGFMSA
ncbi:hypothetical protein L3X38_009048 [Prunus dulcis]|uniref:Uncharacterized protein n=1 Tax=Prunus dulcis TaxID=3755 RepID=A0AAD4ZXM7_PRUDU|nr:hypothetical protein L3X38_009048 [Prunus dulcis]